MNRSGRPSLSRSANPAPQQTKRVSTPGADGESVLECDVCQPALAVVLVKHAGVVGEMRFQNPERAVQLVVAHADAHPGLLGAIFAQRAAALQSFFGEGSVVAIPEKQTGRGIAGDVDVGPAVVIKIRRYRGES